MGSIIGIKQETYEKYRRNGNLDFVIDNIKAIIEWRKKNRKNFPKIELQFLVNKYNENEIEDFKRKSIELGVDLIKIKTMRLHSQEAVNEFLPTNNEYARYYKDGTPKKNIINDVCFWPFAGSVVNADGTVMPCCYIGHDCRYVMGNIYEDSFVSIWNSEKYHYFRDALKNHQLEQCNQCVNTNKNPLIRIEKLTSVAGTNIVKSG